MSRIYYNDNDVMACAWIRELISHGHLPEGDVDNRSISEVTADDVRGYEQCHFFAGIGGWPLALRLAAWPDGVTVWTGSCPCQPFSAAGKGKGFDDERHLWPQFARLINECKPPTVFGEQVASKAGREWLSVVFADLEAMGYAAAGADLCAASVGAPHIRQRLFWVADTNGRKSWEAWSVQRSGQYGLQQEGGEFGHGLDDTELHGQYADSIRFCTGESEDKGRLQQYQGCSSGSGMGNTESDGREQRLSIARRSHAGVGAEGQLRCTAGYGGDIGVANSGSKGLEEREEQPAREEFATAERSCNAWSGVEFVECRDGKARPVEPSIRLLAHGVSGRVAQLRGLGNAIVPQVAAEFIRAFIEANCTAEVINGNGQANNSQQR